jgi:predicted  nucleic acid-binding Zn-ribbon protein
MGEKKGKALALELMDDLLNDDVEEGPPIQGKAKKKAKTSPPADADVDDLAVEAMDPAHHDKTEISDPAQTHRTTGENEDRTVRINSPQQAAQGQPAREDKVRASVGRFGAFRAGGPANATEAALAQSESLRIAQQRLLEFEQEIERLRLQNEELAAAAETLRRRTDELTAGNQKRESDYKNAVSTFAQEKEILLESKDSLQREIAAQKQRNEELELRISTNIQKIRVRERELENRLELVKMESAALIRSKDEMILELKRNIDQLNLELTNYRNKNQELNRLTTDKQEMLRRTVKALRLALSMLEGEEDTQKAPLRKVK